ncbi:extracellular solute-binding protein [Paenibacillus elgii]|uniref:extracellular solute-binding protein n=1 Tax=Paenibacillus elgii TaxID=189691 RepID=UPI002D7BD9AD|nr:extracellular solute-binding protein [Paenibacillus elgii]
MKMIKKHVALLTVTVITAALLSACSGNASKEGATASPSVSSAGPSALPDVKLTALFDNNPTFPYSKDWPIWKWIKEKTGVTLEVQTPSGKLGDTLNLTIASRAMPDLMYMPNRESSNKFGQQGALVDILKYIDDMPNLKAWIEKYPEEARAALSSDGKMYMFPNQGFGETNRTVWMYRKDVFDKEGLQIPSNYDELYATLKTLKAKYPDSYPLTIRYGENQDESTANMTVDFETGDGAYYDFDKKEWRYGPTEDNYKAMVATWRKFYVEGLIPPDFLSLQTKQWQDMLSTDKSFITIDYISRIDFFNTAMQKQNPKYNMQFMAPPAGIAGGKQLNPYLHYLQNGLTVSSDSKHIKDVMKYMDFFYSKEGRTLVSWGKEGETYDKEGDTLKFKPEYTDIIELRKATGLKTSGTYAWIDFNSDLSLSSDNLKYAFREAAKYDPPAMQPHPALTETETELVAITGETIRKHRDESFAKFVTGSRSLNEWDQYVNEMNKLGVDKLLETSRNAYKRVQSIKLNVK